MKFIFTFVSVLFCASLFAQAGALDGSFATGGKYIDQYNLNSSYNEGIEAIAIQPDGKIIMGAHSNLDGAGYGDFEVLRFNIDGSLDASFGTGGRTFIDFYKPAPDIYATLDDLHSLALQPDGKIVVAGTSRSYGAGYIDSLRTYNQSNIAVARLNANGSLDNTFNGNGKQVIDLINLTRSTKSGATNYSNDACNGVALRADGRIVLGGYTFNNKNSTTLYPNGDNDVVVIQLSGNGSLDSSFSGDGIQIFPQPGSNEVVSGIALEKNGDAILAGYTGSTSKPNNLLVVSVKASGALDKTFNTTGYVLTDVGSNSDDYGKAVAIQTDGKILVGGYNGDVTTGTSAILVRYNTDGSLDKTFGKNGKSVFTSGKDANQGYAIALQQDGKIIQSGYYGTYSTFTDKAEFTGGDNFQILRYLANGKADSSFGTLGRTVIDLGSWLPNSNTNAGYLRTDNSHACAVQADGKIIAAGSTENYIGSSLSSYQEAAIRVLPSGKNYGLTGPGDTAINITGCTASFPNLDPKLYPDTSLSIVKYRLYSYYGYPPYDSGYGSVSGKPFNIGNTTVVYSSTIDSNQRAVFNINVTGGTPAGALDFDGVDDRVFVGTQGIVSASHTYTFEGWIKVRGYNKNGGSVIFGNERNKDSGVLVSLNGNGFITTYQPKVGTVTSSYKVALNTWTHIAFVQSSSQLDLYVNGNFVQTLLTAPNLQAATNGRFYLGAYTDNDTTFSRFFNGEMDEVRLWSTAICQGQLQNNLHCELASAPTGLLAEFTFNAGLASCKNQGLNTYLYFPFSNSVYIMLQNFYLDGPTSNFVAGYITDTCAPFAPLAITSQPGNITLQSQPGLCGAVANFAVTAKSGCTDSAAITYSQNPGTVFPVGTTYVTATASDGTGNTVNAYFTVAVTDTIKPTLVTKDTTVRLDKNSYAYITSSSVIASLSDNCSSGSNLTYNVYPTSFTSAGAYTVTVSAKDQYNNTTVKNATVTVLPNRTSINSNTFIATGSKASIKKDDFRLQVSPNPSRDHFTLMVQSSDVMNKISLRISDITGKLLDVVSSVTPGESLQIGDKYGAGIYVVEIIQNENRKSYKLVKLP